MLLSTRAPGKEGASKPRGARLITSRTSSPTSLRKRGRSFGSSKSDIVNPGGRISPSPSAIGNPCALNTQPFASGMNPGFKSKL